MTKIAQEGKGFSFCKNKSSSYSWINFDVLASNRNTDHYLCKFYNYRSGTEQEWERKGNSFSSIKIFFFFFTSADLVYFLAPCFCFPLTVQKQSKTQISTHWSEWTASNPACSAYLLLLRSLERSVLTDQIWLLKQRVSDRKASTSPALMRHQMQQNSLSSVRGSIH